MFNWRSRLLKSGIKRGGLYEMMTRAFTSHWYANSPYYVKDLNFFASLHEETFVDKHKWQLRDLLLAPLGNALFAIQRHLPWVDDFFTFKSDDLILQFAKNGELSVNILPNYKQTIDLMSAIASAIERLK